MVKMPQLFSSRYRDRRYNTFIVHYLEAVNLILKVMNSRSKMLTEAFSLITRVDCKFDMSKDYYASN
jgi:hypothetical protein